MAVGKTPRKLKKKMKKLGLYFGGINWVKCLMCQKRNAVCGYDLYFCEKCDNEQEEI